jgi:low affinity Fe/Cu permease
MLLLQRMVAMYFGGYVFFYVFLIDVTAWIWQQQYQA